MWFIIVTTRSLLWILVSLVATLLMLTTLVNPTWLVAKPQTEIFDNISVVYVPSVGVYAKCGKPLRGVIEKKSSYCTSLAVNGLLTESEVFPNVWKASVVFLAFGLTIMTVTVFAGFMSCCCQSVFKKSIFTLSGATQAFAGEFSQYLL